jgi:predicted metalloprotease with PDZ domain
VNSTVSYYQKGELVTLALDLALRRAGKSLDLLVKALWDRHASWGGLPEDGVERALAELIGVTPARELFDAFVRGTAPLAHAWEVVGLKLSRRAMQGFDDKGGTPGKKEAPRAGYLGAQLANGAKVSTVREGSPAWKAGLYAEDEIIAEDGFKVDKGSLWQRLEERGPGGALRLTVFRREELVEIPVTLGEPPLDTLWLEPVEGVTAEQRAAFEAWCGAKLPEGNNRS